MLTPRWARRIQRHALVQRRAIARNAVAATHHSNPNASAGDGRSEPKLLALRIGLGVVRLPRAEDAASSWWAAARPIVRAPGFVTAGPSQFRLEQPGSRERGGVRTRASG